MSSGVPVSGFADHDMVRVRNGTGAVTELLSRRVAGDIAGGGLPRFGADGWANTIEIAHRTGPNVFTSYWIQHDFLRLEMSQTNTAPVLASVGETRQWTS